MNTLQELNKLPTVELVPLAIARIGAAAQSWVAEHGEAKGLWMAACQKASPERFAAALSEATGFKSIDFISEVGMALIKQMGFDTNRRTVAITTLLAIPKPS